MNGEMVNISTVTKEIQSRMSYILVLRIVIVLFMIRSSQKVKWLIKGLSKKRSSLLKYLCYVSFFAPFVSCSHVYKQTPCQNLGNPSKYIYNTGCDILDFFIKAQCI